MNITITSVQLEHTNPSLGPNETKTIVTLTILEEDIKQLNHFLKNSVVNNTTTLYEYINALRTNHSKIIADVLNNAPKPIFAQGETISNLLFRFKDGLVVRLDDVYRQFNLTEFYPEFTSYMLEKGNVIRF